MQTAHLWAPVAEKELCPSGQPHLAPQGQGAVTPCPGRCKCFNQTSSSRMLVGRTQPHLLFSPHCQQPRSITGFDLTSVRMCQVLSHIVGLWYQYGLCLVAETFRVTLFRLRMALPSGSQSQCCTCTCFFPLQLRKQLQESNSTNQISDSKISLIQDTIQRKYIPILDYFFWEGRSEGLYCRLFFFNVRGIEIIL